MKPLLPFRMSPGLCGPACLKIILSHYKKDFSEQELANLCNVTPEDHASHSAMVAAVESVGGKAADLDDAKIDDIRKFVDDNVPVIVGWQLDGKNHYTVVYDVGKNKIFMMDPGTESGIRIMPIEQFENAWFDMDESGNSVKRWMLAVKI